MNPNDPLLSGRFSPPTGSPGPFIEPDEPQRPKKNQDAHVSDLEARMAKSAAQREAEGVRAQTGAGRHRAMTILALWVPLIFTLVLFFLAIAGQRARDLDAKWILHTVEVKDQVEHLNSLVRDIGAGERGYLLTRDTSFLPLYESALKEIPAQSDKIAQLIADNPRQVLAAAHLHVLIAEKLSIAAQALAQAEKNRAPETIEMYRDTQEKPLNDEIRAQVDAMTAEEDRLLAVREDTFSSQVRSERNEMIGLVAVEIALIAGLTLILQRLRRLQLTADERIEEANVMTDQAKASTFKAVVRTDQAEARAAEATTKTQAAEATTSLLTTCIAHLSDIVLITEADSTEEPGPRIVFVNEAFERMTGYTSAEALGRSPRFLQGPKTDRRVLDEIHQAVAQRKPIRRQIINYRKDGSEFWLDIDIVPIFDAAGTCTHFAGIERDITEEKKTTASLDLFRTLMDRSPDAIEVVDARTGRFLHVNATACQRLGYSLEEMLSLSIPDVIVAGEIPFSMEANVQDIRKTGIKIIETRHRRKDGSTFPTEINTQYIDLDQGYLVAVIRDITERKRAEEVRRMAEERYRTLFDYAPDGILIVSPENIYIDANVSICQMLGYTRDELIGLSVQEIVAEKDLQRIDPALSVIRAQANHHREWDFRRKDGSILQVDAFSTLMPDGNVLAMIRDITERKKNEARFRRLVDSNAQGVIFWNRSGKITGGNDAFLQMVDQTREDLEAGRVNWVTLTPPEYVNLDELALDQLTANGSCEPYEKEYMRKNGVRVPVLIGSAVFEDNLDEGVSFVVDISKRKRSEEELHVSEARYSTLFANMLGGYAYCLILFEQGHAVDLIYLEVNKSFEALTGLKDVVGKKLSEVSPGLHESNPELYEIYGRVALTGKSEKFETYLKPLGIWLSISVYSNEAEHIMVVFENISERKRNEGRFRRLVDSNAQSVMFWNTKGEITGANDACLKLLRYTREDLEAASFTWMSITPPEYLDLDRHFMEQVTATGACAPYRKEFFRKDGGRVSVLLGGANFEDNPDEGVAFMLDLTEREAAADQLAEQAALLDEAQDAIIVRDFEGTAIYWNKGAERMYGWSREEVLGVNMSQLLFNHPKEYAEIIALTIRHGKWSGDLKNLTKDKREITVEARWTLIQDKEGNPKAVLAINTDITEKKKIEAQFMRAQRMESIGTLAGGIAHDLNNILAPIMMSIDILKLTATDLQAKSILDTIEASSRRGSDIVRQVLSFARGLEGERVEIQLAHLLRELECIIKNTFPKNIRLQFPIPNDTWMILGDPTQVHQILLNLCVNARDAMPDGGDLTIQVENCTVDEQYAAMRTGTKPGRYVNISVTDSGTGIPQDILNKIFEPFFTTKKINEGTGLGLSTVMAIITNHEGMINVYSECGKGTIFKVYLPALELSAEAQKQLTQQISVPRGKGETVLVIDDESSVLAITSQTLQAFGYRVLSATDGAEAVAVYAEHVKEIAVVVTDMSMPILDGAGVIRALIQINPAVEIIAASGLNANIDLAQVSGLALKHFLTKPYTAGTLLKLVRTILDKSQIKSGVGIRSED